MKNQAEILQEMIDDYIACNTGVTMLGRGGVVYGILNSLSYPVSGLYYNYDKLERSRYLATAIGTELDVLGDERGIDRQEANAAGVVLSFLGVDGSVVPSGTQVTASNGTVFETNEELIIGSDIDGIPGEDGTVYAFTSKAYAEATTAGTVGNVPAKSITRLVTPIVGVTVINYLPGENGQNAEPDNHYRARIARTASVLDVKTIDFFYAKAREHSDEILRVLPVRQSIRVVKLWIVTKSGRNFSDPELIALEDYIGEYCDPVLTIECSNTVFTPITIKLLVDLEAGAVLADVYNNVANALVQFVDWSNWVWGEDVDDADLLEACNVDGINNIHLDEFYTHLTGLVNTPGDVVVNGYSLPRMIHLEINESTGGSTSDDISDSYDFVGTV